MSKWLGIAGLAVAVVVAVLLFATQSDSPDIEDAVPGDPETRIIEYLNENVRPGQPVLVTDLYNNVFTSPEEREALEQLYDAAFALPAAAAVIYTETGRVPTLQELSDQFQFHVPGTTDVLLRVLESDPRVPRFFERDAATGEIISIDVERIASDERFGRSLRDR